MKFLAPILCAALLAGCAGSHPGGIARNDDYDSVRVEQMVGNKVSGSVFERVIVCLNARRETRRLNAVTNTVVTAVTNQVVAAITNLTISLSTNLLFTTMTNLAPAPPPAPAVPAGDAGAETNAATVVVLVTNTGPTITTNITVSLANNASATQAPNQRTANNQQVRTFNNQLTSSSNNVSIAQMTNVIVTAETNQVVNYLTNIAIVSVTNQIVTSTNGLVYDYFLYSEMTPPPDFTPGQGETLVLLVDGVRHGFTPSQSGTAFVARRGYNSALYRVSPEVLVAIGNAREVRIRFKGVNNVVEREMNSSSRQHFRHFLAKYFVPEPDPGPSTQSAAAPASAPRSGAAGEVAGR